MPGTGRVTTIDRIVEAATTNDYISERGRSHVHSTRTRMAFEIWRELLSIGGFRAELVNSDSITNTFPPTQGKKNVYVYVPGILCIPGVVPVSSSSPNEELSWGKGESDE